MQATTSNTCSHIEELFRGAFEAYSKRKNIDCLEKITPFLKATVKKDRTKTVITNEVCKYLLGGENDQQENGRVKREPDRSFALWLLTLFLDTKIRRKHFRDGDKREVLIQFLFDIIKESEIEMSKGVLKRSLKLISKISENEGDEKIATKFINILTSSKYDTNGLETQINFYISIICKTLEQPLELPTIAENFYQRIKISKDKNHTKTPINNFFTQNFTWRVTTQIHNSRAIQTIDLQTIRQFKNFWKKIVNSLANLEITTTQKQLRNQNQLVVRGFLTGKLQSSLRVLFAPNSSKRDKLTLSFIHVFYFNQDKILHLSEMWNFCDTPLYHEIDTHVLKFKEKPKLKDQNDRNQLTLDLKLKSTIKSAVLPKSLAFEIVLFDIDFNLYETISERSENGKSIHVTCKSDSSFALELTSENENTRGSPLIASLGSVYLLLPSKTKTEVQLHVRITKKHKGVPAGIFLGFAVSPYTVATVVTDLIALRGSNSKRYSTTHKKPEIKLAHSTHPYISELGDLASGYLFSQDEQVFGKVEDVNAVGEPDLSFSESISTTSQTSRSDKQKRKSGVMKKKKMSYDKASSRRAQRGKERKKEEVTSPGNLARVKKLGKSEGALKKKEVKTPERLGKKRADSVHANGKKGERRKSWRRVRSWSDLDRHDQKKIEKEGITEEQARANLALFLRVLRYCGFVHEENPKSGHLKGNNVLSSESKAKSDTQYEDLVAKNDERLIKEPPKPIKKMYKMLDQTGRGGYGKVYAAKELTKRKGRVAIKKLSADKVRRNIVEIRALATCAHPNIVTYCDAWLLKEQSQVWLVMELLSGGTLAEANVRTQWEERHIAHITRSVLKALEYLHKRNIIHRDVKPENVMLSLQGQVKLIDFGLCDTVVEGKPLTGFCGSRPYIPPEMINGGVHTFGVDIWSLAVSVLEMQEGHLTHVKMKPLKSLWIVATKGLRYLLDDAKRLTPAQREFLFLCLNPDPKGRPSATELLNHRFLRRNNLRAGFEDVLRGIFISNTVKNGLGF